MPSAKQVGALPGDSSSTPARIWPMVAICGGLLFAVLAIHAAWVETPTVDEFAHLPAGCVYLKHGDLNLYHKNPPLMKYAMAIPAMVYPGVQVPEPRPAPTGWAPWIYGYQ